MHFLQCKVTMTNTHRQAPRWYVLGSSNVISKRNAGSQLSVTKLRSAKSRRLIEK